MAFRRTTERPSSFRTAPRPSPTITEHAEHEIENKPISSLRIVFARVFWCFAGPLLLALWTLRIALVKDGWSAPSDIGFLVILGLIIAARWYCFSADDRTDGQGNVSSAAQMNQFTKRWLLTGSLIWFGANMIGNFLVR